MHKIILIIISVNLLCPVYVFAALVAQYNFNGNASDLSGYNNDGTVYGATLTEDRFGNPNSAFYFDGIDDYIDLGNGASINTTDSITLSAWIYSESLSSGRIISKWGFNSGYELDIYDSELRFNINQHAEVPYSIDGIQGSWIFVAGTYDGAAKNLYLNGELVHSYSPVYNNIAISPNNLLIGAMSNLSPSYFEGIIDDIRIYNTALSDNEISEIYATPVPAAVWLFGSGLLGLIAMRRKTIK